MKTKLFVLVVLVLTFAAVINAGNVIVKNGRINVSGVGSLRLRGGTDWGLETDQAPSLQIIDRTNNIRRGIFDTSGNVYLGGSITNVNGADATISILNTGRVGIGTDSPQTLLDIDGTMRLVPVSSSTCDSSRKGALYFDSDDDHFYGCNGASWIMLDTTYS